MPLHLTRPLVLVGAGNMGGALLKGWLAGGLDPTMVIALDPAPPPQVRATLAGLGVTCLAAPPTLDRPDAAPAAIVLAVKPQIMDAVLPSIAPLTRPDTVILSVAAGRTLISLTRHFPSATAVVRSIPNTPAAVGRGITVAIANGFVTSEQRQLCDTLLAAVGEVAWVDDEKLIDAATAVSGSGPAYVFLLAECLAEAGRNVGLTPELAQKLARATVCGAGELMHQSDQAPATLRQNVTSPKGTTAAALEVLMGAAGLQQLLTRAVAAAEARARELAV